MKLNRINLNLIWSTTWLTTLTTMVIISWWWECSHFSRCSLRALFLLFLNQLPNIILRSVRHVNLDRSLYYLHQDGLLMQHVNSIYSINYPSSLQVYICFLRRFHLVWGVQFKVNQAAKNSGLHDLLWFHFHISPFYNDKVFLRFIKNFSEILNAMWFALPPEEF